MLKSGSHKKEQSKVTSVRWEQRLAADLAMVDPWVLSFWFSEQPAVHYCSEAHLPFLASQLPAGTPPVVHLVQPMWALDPEYAKVLHDWLKRRRPQDRMIFLLNEEALVPACEALGLEAWFIHQNAFLDETFWRPATADLTVIHDAVYNARMVRFKRHDLAKQIRRVGLICPPGDPEEKDWTKHMEREMPDAVRYAANGVPLTSEEVRTVLWRSRVGLCLSEEEGGMYAAGEHALCGLPIVSTPSRGGREAFVDLPGNRVVPAEAGLISAAVADIPASPSDPTFVRLDALRVICAHRQRFITLGQSIYESPGCGRDFGRDFYLRFTNKLGGFRPWRRSASAGFQRHVRLIQR